MRLHEFEAADIFESVGIPTPKRGVATTVSEALEAASRIGYPVMLKAQVLVGSRGLAGGIKSASDPKESKRSPKRFLPRKSAGCPCAR